MDTRRDVRATPSSNDGFVWQDAKSSPDGIKLLVKRYTPGAGTYQLAIIGADGEGEPIAIGPVQAPDTQTDWQFSPDGTQVLARFETDGLWLFDADGSGEQQLDWPAAAGLTWQRLAP
jgi:hypothetical protein